MTIEPIGFCEMCKHRIGNPSENKCKAYPNGIPESILHGAHIIPMEGDNGYLFEPADEWADKTEYIETMVEIGESLNKYLQISKALNDANNIEKDLGGGERLKSEQPLEDWADEFLSKNVIKADLHLFVQALMNIKHWIFNTLSPAQSENLYTALVERMTADKWSLKDLTKTIQEAEPLLDEAQAETIARSESTLIVNKSRELQFTRDPPGKYGYYWSGPADHRTTEICAAIKARTPKGGFDSPEELSRVIQEEAQKYYSAKGYKTQVREWLPHPNCRHTIVSKMR